MISSFFVVELIDCLGALFVLLIPPTCGHLVALDGLIGCHDWPRTQGETTDNKDQRTQQRDGVGSDKRPREKAENACLSDAAAGQPH